MDSTRKKNPKKRDIMNPMETTTVDIEDKANAFVNKLMDDIN